MNENSIIERISSGDIVDLAHIYKFYRVEFISWIIKTYSCTPDEAKDIYQFSILVFYENIKNGRLRQLKSSIKTYLFAIGKNKVMEEKRARNKFIYQEDNTNTIKDDPIATEEMDERHENQLKTVEKCLKILGEPCKSILEQYYYHKKSMEEITSTLDYKNADTVKNLKYKCINRLRKSFEEESFKINRI